MQAITQVENVFFDVLRIEQEIEHKIYQDSCFSSKQYDIINQISLRGNDWFDGTGSFYDRVEKKITGSTHQYTKKQPKLAGSYLEEVIDTIENLAVSEGVRIGRIRIMRMQPKTCLSLHTDRDEFRYHIPLRTNYQCFFVAGTAVERMPTPGAVYRFKTNIEHTAVNASFEVRTHIVFDTFDPTAKI